MAVSDGPGPFGVLLSQHRATAGLSQEELAERAGLSRRGISDLERGERRLPHPSTVRRLADALGLEDAERTRLLASIRPTVTRLPGISATGGEPNHVAAPSTYAARSATLPLVGRSDEWNRLQAAWRAASAGAPALVVIAGEPGIGKTRLADEMLSWASGRGIGTAAARAHAAEGRLSYGPVVDWLRSETLRPSIRQLDARSLTDVGRLVPDLLSDEPPASLGDGKTEPRQRHLFFRSLAQAALGTSRPLLLLLDDLQWCDQDTLEWLHYLLRFDSAAPLLVEGTVRPEEVGRQHPLHPLLNDLRRTRQLTELRLGPLDTADVAELAACVAGRDLDPEELRRLYDETEGQPLFVVEVVRAGLGADDTAAHSGSRLSLTSGTIGAPGAPQLPPKVHAVISARLSQLSEAARETVRFAATIGRSFTLDLLVHSGAGEIDTLAQPLDELWERQIVREHGTNAYDFAHDKIREVAYAEIRPAQRALLHRRVARALQAVHSANRDAVSAQIAAHYDRAGMPLEAIGFYQRAADVARRVYAYQGAVDLLERAVVLVESLPQNTERDERELAVQTALGACLVSTRGYAGAGVTTAYQRSRALAQRLGKPSDPPALRALAIEAVTQTEFELAYTLGKQLLDQAGHEADPVLLVEANYVLGVTLFWMGKFAEARTHLEAALAHYDRSRSSTHIASYSQDPAVICLARLAIVLWFLGAEELATRRANEGVRLAERISHPFSLAYSLAWAALLYTLRGDADASRRYADAVVALSRERGQELWQSGLATASILRGWAIAETEDIDEGVDAMQQGIAILDSLGTVFTRPWFVGLLAEQCARGGQVDKGLSLLQQALATVQASGERCWEADLYWRKGLVLQQRLDARAVEAFERALSVAHDQGAKAIERRAAASLASL
jgi:predicted ATPase/DNA-binding XRE family transcriptional regulator